MTGGVRIAFLLATLGGCIGVGYLATTLSPVFALGAALAGVSTLLVIRSSAARLTAATAGALLVFQAPGDAPKMVYFALLILCFGLAVVNLLRRPANDLVAARLRPIVVAGGALGLFLVASFVVSSANGIPFVDWFRDSLGYWLLVVLPVVGVEAAGQVRMQFLNRLILVLGLAAAIGFALDWLDRRGAAATTGRVVLATLTFTIFAIIFATLRAGTARSGRTVWFGAAILMTGALIVTGTRTALLLILVAFVSMAGSSRKARINAKSWIALGTLFVVALFVAVSVIQDAIAIDSAFLSGRFESLYETLQGGLTQDQSFVVRQSSYRVAQARWEDAPWIGGGPGYIYPSTGLYSLDTPWMTPAKFGAVGTLALLAYFALIVLCLRRVSRLSGSGSPELTAVRAWFMCMVALTPFGAWPEDKGTGLVLMLLIALVGEAHANAGKKQRTSPDSSLHGPVITD